VVSQVSDTPEILMPYGRPVPVAPRQGLDQITYLQIEKHVVSVAPFMDKWIIYKNRGPINGQAMAE
jgi:hypothetical protein